MHYRLKPDSKPKSSIKFAPRRLFLLQGIFFALLFGWGGFSLVGCSGEYSGLVHFEVVVPENKNMEQDFPQAFCLIDQRGQVMVVLLSRQSFSDESISRTVRQMLILRTFWLPQKGQTPTTPSGTNINLEYLVEVDDQAAWYRGAGFAFVHERNSRRNCNVDIRSSALSLNLATPGFGTTFTVADVTGKATALYDPQRVRDLVDQFEKRCRNLKRP